MRAGETQTDAAVSPTACPACRYSLAGLDDPVRCPECGHQFGPSRPGHDPRAAERDAAACLAIGIVCVPLVILPCVDFLLPFVGIGFGLLSLYRTCRTRRFIAWPPLIAGAGITLALISFALKIGVFGLAIFLQSD